MVKMIIRLLQNCVDFITGETKPRIPFLVFTEEIRRITNTYNLLGTNTRTQSLK